MIVAIVLLAVAVVALGMLVWSARERVAVLDVARHQTGRALIAACAARDDARRELADLRDEVVALRADNQHLRLRNFQVSREAAELRDSCGDIPTRLAMTIIEKHSPGAQAEDDCRRAPVQAEQVGK